MGDIQYLVNRKDPYIHTHPEHIGLGYVYETKDADNLKTEDVEERINQTWVDFHNKLIDQGKQAYLLSFFENKLVLGKGHEKDFEEMATLIKKGRGLKKIGEILDSVDDMLAAALAKNTTYMDGLETVQKTYSKATEGAKAYANFMMDKGDLEKVFEEIGELYDINKTLFDRLKNKERLMAACSDYVHDRPGPSLIGGDDFEKLRSLLDKIKNKEEYMKDKKNKSPESVEETLTKSFHQLITYLQISEQSIVSKLAEDKIDETLQDLVREYQHVKGQSSLNFNSYLVTGKNNIQKDKAQPKTDKDILINTEYFTLEIKKGKTLEFDFLYADLSMKFYTQFFNKETYDLNLKGVELGSSGYKLWEAFMVAKNDARIGPERYYYLVNSLAHTMNDNNTKRLGELKDILIKRFFLDTLVSRSKGKNEFNDYLFVNGRAYPVIGIFKDIFMTETGEQKLTFSGMTGKEKYSLKGIAKNINIDEVSKKERPKNIHFNNLRNALADVPLGGKLSGLQNFNGNVVSWGDWTN